MDAEAIFERRRDERFTFHFFERGRRERGMRGGGGSMRCVGCVMRVEWDECGSWWDERGRGGRKWSVKVSQYRQRPAGALGNLHVDLTLDQESCSEIINHSIHVASAREESFANDRHG